MLRSNFYGIVTLSAAVLALSLVSGLAKKSAAAEFCDEGTSGTTSVQYDSPVSSTYDGNESGSTDHAPPQRCGMVAPSYPVPHEVPWRVGRTYFTYPPVMPHHSLPHYRKVYSYRHGPGMVRTTVNWHKSYVCSALHWLHNIIELPR